MQYINLGLCRLNPIHVHVIYFVTLFFQSLVSISSYNTLVTHVSSSFPTGIQKTDLSFTNHGLFRPDIFTQLTRARYTCLFSCSRSPKFPYDQSIRCILSSKQSFNFRQLSNKPQQQTSLEIMNGENWEIMNEKN